MKKNALMITYIIIMIPVIAIYAIQLFIFQFKVGLEFALVGGGIGTVLLNYVFFSAAIKSETFSIWAGVRAMSFLAFVPLTFMPILEDSAQWIGLLISPVACVITVILILRFEKHKFNERREALNDGLTGLFNYHCLTVCCSKLVPGVKTDWLSISSIILFSLPFGFLKIVFLLVKWNEKKLKVEE